MSGKTIEVCRSGKSWVKGKFRVSRPLGSISSIGRSLQLEIDGHVVQLKNMHATDSYRKDGTVEDGKSVFRWRKISIL